jgi:hypothetical protein
MSTYYYAKPYIQYPGRLWWLASLANTKKISPGL